MEIAEKCITYAADCNRLESCKALMKFARWEEAIFVYINESHQAKNGRI